MVPARRCCRTAKARHIATTAVAERDATAACHIGRGPASTTCNARSSLLGASSPGLSASGELPAAAVPVTAAEYLASARPDRDEVLGSKRERAEPLFQPAELSATPRKEQDESCLYGLARA